VVRARLRVIISDLISPTIFHISLLFGNIKDYVIEENNANNKIIQELIH